MAGLLGCSVSFPSSRNALAAVSRTGGSTSTNFRSCPGKRASAVIDERNFDNADKGKRPVSDKDITSSSHLPVVVENEDSGLGTVVKRMVHNGFSGLFFGIPFTKLCPDFVRSVKSQFSANTKLLLACQEGLSISVEGGLSNRREALGKFILLALSFPLLGEKDAVAATDEEFQTYKDEKEKFSISFPKDWLTGVGDASGFKSVTAFLPKEESDSNVTVAITGIGPDFTRLESFGKVDEFAESLVNGLDRSWKNPPGLAAKLINAKSANGFYYVEYTLQNPGERCRHIFSAIGMANNGWYNRLYTVTGQFIEDGAEKYRSQIEQTVSSFRFIK